MSFNCSTIGWSRGTRYCRGHLFDERRVREYEAGGRTKADGVDRAVLHRPGSPWAVKLGIVLSRSCGRQGRLHGLPQNRQLPDDGAGNGQGK